MYNSSRELIEALSAAPDVLTALLRNVSEEQARQARGGDENWSVIEVVCHLRDTEEFALQRMRAIRDRSNPRLTGFDQEAWSTERHYAAAHLGDSLAAFLHFRTQHIAELGRLSPDQWERTGHHEKHGPTTISNHTLHIVWHDAVHAAQSARQLHS
jgi:hypothetical protein